MDGKMADAEILRLRAGLHLILGVRKCLVDASAERIPLDTSAVPSTPLTMCVPVALPLNEPRMRWL